MFSDIDKNVALEFNGSRGSYASLTSHDGFQRFPTNHTYKAKNQNDRSCPHLSVLRIVPGEKCSIPPAVIINVMWHVAVIPQQTACSRNLFRAISPPPKICSKKAFANILRMKMTMALNKGQP